MSAFVTLPRNGRKAGGPKHTTLRRLDGPKATAKEKADAARRYAEAVARWEAEHS